jgi:hypothetical protein
MISRGGRSVAGFALGAPLSYDAAIAANPQQIDLSGHATTPDLTNDQLAAPMAIVGSSLGKCGAPDDMKVTVKVAIKLGKAVGVTVGTEPANATVASCVDRMVRKLQWPSSPKLDSFTTQY